MMNLLFLTLPLSAFILLLSACSPRDGDDQERPDQADGAKIEVDESGWFDGFEGTQAGASLTIGGIEMVWCPPGEFLMGSPPAESDRKEDEEQHLVRLTKGFWMAKYELTQEQWSSVIEGSNPSANQGSVRLPVERISWVEAVEWCEKATKNGKDLSPGWTWQLPTEAQWEYACRAGTKTPIGLKGGVGYLSAEMASFEWKFPYQSSVEGVDPEEPVEVGSFEPNEWGLHDMHGNVYEWCQDLYGSDYYSDSAAGVNPEGVPEGGAEGWNRVCRGGSWNDKGKSCRSAARMSAVGVGRDFTLGFRPVVAAVPSVE